MNFTVSKVPRWFYRSNWYKIKNCHIRSVNENRLTAPSKNIRKPFTILCQPHDRVSRSNFNVSLKPLPFFTVTFLFLENHKFETAFLKKSNVPLYFSRFHEKYCESSLPNFFEKIGETNPS